MIYCVLDVVSDSVVSDSVYSVGIAIMTYYSVVAISSVVYFWRTAFRSWRTAMGQVILPGIGALILIPVGVVEAFRAQVRAVPCWASAPRSSSACSAWRSVWC
ncbi:hypothetical protein [Mycolicibacterium gadium]|uniref:hypothetical protein n=1 Tax=Mycolicibacterium gadium TaxID=1794 RepID=UPI0021F3C18F|nr:hypothetical protein [Mycolicibacterium gadium]